MGQRSQGELCTERQSNGRLTYNSAPQVRPDRFADPLLHQHGTHQASAASYAGSLGYAELLAIRNSGQAHAGNFFVALLKRKFLGIILNNSLNVRHILWIPAVRPLDTAGWEGLPHGDLRVQQP